MGNGPGEMRMYSAVSQDSRLSSKQGPANVERVPECSSRGI